MEACTGCCVAVQTDGCGGYARAASAVGVRSLYSDCDTLTHTHTVIVTLRMGELRCDLNLCEKSKSILKGGERAHAGLLFKCTRYPSQVGCGGQVTCNACIRLTEKG